MMLTFGPINSQYFLRCLDKKGEKILVFVSNLIRNGQTERQYTEVGKGTNGAL